MKMYDLWSIPISCVDLCNHKIYNDLFLKTILMIINHIFIDDICLHQIGIYYKLQKNI